MSVPRQRDLPMGESPARARAKETIWRLASLAFAHPAPEFQEVLENGHFAEAFDQAWSAVTGRPWPAVKSSASFATLEAGFIRTFLHGPKGKPIASLLAGDYEHLLAGLSRPVFMLNIGAFYRHFDLKAATADEGHADEPDHLASMLEFMAVLAHFEAQALEKGTDPSPGRRAQRDFLRRYLVPMLRAVDAALRQCDTGDLDPTLRQLCAELPDWAESLATELETRVGHFRDPDRTSGTGPNATGAKPRFVDQNLWG